MTTTNESPGLSLKGEKQQHSTNQYLRESGMRIGCIYTSPVRRAVETAEIVGKSFLCPVVVEEALGNTFREERLIAIIQDSPFDTMCLIGHAPTLPDFAQSLAGKTPVPDIGRSSALIMEVEKEGSSLQCHPLLYITPDGIAQIFDRA
jgi:phosphohistidine phosphatase SixA